MPHESSDHPRRPLNIIIFGEVGVGKSSLINLIVGQGLAEVSDDATPCTVESAKYTFSLPGSHRDLDLYDTMSLNDPTLDSTKYLDAVAKAQDLIVSLQKTGGVHGLLFCISGRRVSDSVRRNNKLFYKFLCKEKVPLVLVITGLENETGDMDKWWVRNQARVEKSGVTSVAHACITAIKGYDEQRYLESRTKMLNVLSVFWSDLRQSYPSISMEDSSHVPPPNFIIFGEMGAGQSSVINLITGNPGIAETSSGVKSCTLKSTEYSIRLPDSQHQVNLYDTAGLNEPTMNNTIYADAVGNAHDLINSLQKKGGVHGLLFCIRGGRITNTVQGNYKMFYEVLCRKRVPIALVITGLENEPDDMDNWWADNRIHVEKSGIASVAHVCITTIRGRNNAYEDRYLESRKKVHQMLNELADCVVNKG